MRKDWANIKDISLAVGMDKELATFLKASVGFGSCFQRYFESFICNYYGLKEVAEYGSK